MKKKKQKVSLGFLCGRGLVKVRLIHSISKGGRIKGHRWQRSPKVSGRSQEVGSPDTLGSVLHTPFKFLGLSLACSFPDKILLLSALTAPS